MLFKTMRRSGLRISEALALEPHDILQVGERCKIRARLGKGRKARAGWDGYPLRNSATIDARRSSSSGVGVGMSKLMEVA